MFSKSLIEDYVASNDTTNRISFVLNLSRLVSACDSSRPLDVLTSFCFYLTTTATLLRLMNRREYVVEEAIGYVEGVWSLLVIDRRLLLSLHGLESSVS
jgi:hypothetical protein